MPALTRRRDLEAPDECWHVYYGDVRAGTIAKRVGIPFDEDLWGWACASTRAHTRANARTVRPLPSTTRAEFEEAWRIFLSNRTKADFQEWREAQG